MARDRLTGTQKDALDTLLQSWDVEGHIYSNAAANVRMDRGSDIPFFSGYLATLASNHTQLGVSPAGPKVVFQHVGKSFALQGRSATPFKDAIFGRAILLEKYSRDYLPPALDQLGCLDTREEILTALRVIANTNESVAPSRFRVYFEGVRRTALGRGAVFATFTKPVSIGGRPWSSPLPDAYGVRNTIALGEDPVGKDYILFSYRLPTHIAPKVPTSASPGWSYQRWFRPSQKADTELHGWTVPIATGSPRPEIVHSEINGATIEFPINIALA